MFTFDQDIKQWALCREVSEEIASEIFKRAKDDLELAQRIWEDPTKVEKRIIIFNSFKLTEQNELDWGDTIYRDDFLNKQ